MVKSVEEKDFAKPLRGFERIKRYWDEKYEKVCAKILPGEYYVTAMDEGVTTVLGSCVSACIRDRVFGIGGMNHFMLPRSETSTNGSWDNTTVSASARYGNFAMEHLINNILSNGGRRSNLEVKVFGGGRILAQMTDIGKKNIEFVLEYIKHEGLNLLSQDLGDIFPRKVMYFPATGKVLVKKLKALEETVIKREKEYLDSLRQKPVEGEIDLFD